MYVDLYSVCKHIGKTLSLYKIVDETAKYGAIISVSSLGKRRVFWGFKIKQKWSCTCIFYVMV